MPALKSEEEKARPKAAGIMIGKRGSRGLLGRVKNVSADNKAPVLVNGQDTRVLEAFLAADSEASESKRCRIGDDGDEDELQPIGYEARPEPTPKPRIGDTSSVGKVTAAAAGQRTLGPAVPEDLLERIGSNHTESKIDLRLPTPGEEAAAASVTIAADTVAAETSTEEVEPKKIRGDRGSRRRKKPEEEEDEEKVSKCTSLRLKGMQINNSC
jgi:hypothetical protein